MSTVTSFPAKLNQTGFDLTTFVSELICGMTESSRFLASPNLSVTCAGHQGEPQ